MYIINNNRETNLARKQAKNNNKGLFIISVKS